ncbi:unnamed protein product [Ectocarpus sp. CCAP 1310/34]|nr:unnamed protein product [Ectocarpus sp. CCAP 1310/34]
MSIYRAPSHFRPVTGLPIGIKDNTDELKGQKREDSEAPMTSSETTRPATNATIYRSYSTRQTFGGAGRVQFGGDETVDSLWPPHETVTADRCKANVAWVALLGGVIFWVVKLVACDRSHRLNPPVRIYEKAEPFGFPDVALCPTAGAGCDAGDPLECLEGMQLFVSALSGFEDDAELFTASLATQTVTPATATAPSPSPAAAAAESGVSPPPAAAAVATTAPTITVTTTTAAAATTTAAEAAPAASGAAAARLAAMMDTTAHSWCPTIPLSRLTVDWDGIASGDVQSLHASVYVLWSDEVAETPVSSTRRFINTFLIGEGDEGDDFDLENAVVTLARLPYDRISVDATNASESITFVSNDVVSRRQRNTSTRTIHRGTFVNGKGSFGRESSFSQSAGGKRKDSDVVGGSSSNCCCTCKLYRWVGPVSQVNRTYLSSACSISPPQTA